MQYLKNVLLFASTVLSAMVWAQSLSVTSADIGHGEFMSKAQEFQGFGCNGSNVSPQLSWSGAPKGTRAFAVLAYDPDAPTGSGWWHWQVVNIPRYVTNLRTGAGDANKNLMPSGSIQISNDYGVKGFGGACPPEKDGAHRYQFTVHALSKKLQLPENASGALTGYMVNVHSLASGVIEGVV